MQAVKAGIREALFRLPAFQRCWGAYKCWQLHRDYDRRREHYHAIAGARKLAYSEAGTRDAVRKRLEARGCLPPKRLLGEIHSFAFVPQIGWHRHLLPDLHELGPVTLFDYAEHGYRPEQFWHSAARRAAMNELVLPALRKAHAARPVDWVFSYASGLELSASLVRRITDELGLPTVNMCLDDKQSWAGPPVGDQRAGQIDLAACFDLSWTSARVACEWYLVEGGRPLYMPEGFDASFYKPEAVERDLQVSFAGGAYGSRPAVVRYLRRHGVPIHVFGSGWGTPAEVSPAEHVRIINRSQIVLGMGEIGYSEMLTNVKGRDFEVPGTGGGVYLTSFNADLATHYTVGREILCYRNREEMVELIRYCLSHPDEARAIAARGRERCLREHRWLHRYCHILAMLGVFAPDAGTQGNETASTHP